MSSPVVTHNRNPLHSDPRMLRLILILGGIMGIGLGLLVNYRFPKIYAPAEVYLLAGGIAILIGVSSWFVPHIRRRIYDYGFLAYLVVYLALVFLAYLNQMQASFVTILIASQVLFAVSFRNLWEYGVFAVSSLGLFFASSYTLERLVFPREAFLILMTAVTFLAGIFVWVRARSLSRMSHGGQMLGDVLDASIFAIFLLDNECREIRYQNGIANLYLDHIHNRTHIGSHELFSILGLDAEFVKKRLQQVEPGYQEKSYFNLKLLEGDRDFELYLSKIRSQDEENVLLKFRDITDLREQERALNRSHRVNESLLNAFPDALLLIDKDGHVKSLRVAPSFPSEYPLEDFVNQHFSIMLSRFMSTTKQREAQALLRQVEHAEEPLEMEFLTDWGNEKHHYDLRLVNLADEQEILGIIRDVTRARKVEMALRQSEQNYREIFNTGTDGILIVDPSDFQILDANEVSNELLGYSKAALKGKRLVELAPEGQGDIIAHFLDQTVKGTAQRLECELQQADEGRLEAELSAKLAILGGEFRLLVTLRNIAERLRFQRAQIERADELQRSEQKFRSLFDGVSEAIFVYDFNGKLLDANPAACRLHKNDREALIGQSISALTPAKQRDFIEGAFAMMVMGQLTYLESFALAKDEEIIPIEIRSSQVDLEGQPALILHVSNISQRKAQEERLRLFRTLLNQSSDAIFVLGAESHEVLDCNEQLPLSLGYSLPEIKSLDFDKFGRDPHGKPFPAGLWADIQAAGTHIIRGRHLRKDGSSFPVEINLRYVSLPKEAYIVGVARDLTERLEQEASLQQSEQRYRTLVENMNEGLILTDREEKILFVNQRLCEIFGLSREALLGQHSYDALDSDENREIIKEKSRMRLSGISDQYELRIVRNDGQVVWVLVTGAPYVDADDRIIGTISIITDITDRKKTELKLQEKNNELDAFVYKASHDLKGPLASIIGVTQIARDDVKDPEAHRYLDLIAKSTERLDIILSELLDVTRINKAELNFEEIDLEALIREILSSLQHLPESQEVNFRLDIRLTQPIHSDRKLLTSILQNLIVNSIHYQSPEREPHVSIKARENALLDRFDFLISDNGQGMPERIRKRVFEMFYRGNTASKGSGLGLYIVKNSIEKLEGICELESSPGEGTTFRFSLPKVRQPEIQT